MQEVKTPIYESPEATNALRLTPAAYAHIKKMLAKQDKKGFRLSIERSGCSGFSYVVDYVESVNICDLRFSIENVDIFIDQSSFSYLKGTCIDYVQKGLNGSLKFINPNQTATCGCGESFSVEEKIED